MRFIRNFIHDSCTGSWFGFPNPRYMSFGVWREEMAFTLFCYATVLLLLGFGFLVAGFFVFDLWPIATALSLFGVSTVIGITSMLL